MMKLRAAILVFGALTWACNLPAAPHKLSLGDDARVVARGQQGELAAVDADTWERMTKSIAARDHTGIAQQMTMGLVFVIPDGTRVRVIDSVTNYNIPETHYGEMLYRVRVLEGSEKDKAGFLDSSLVKGLMAR